MSRLVAPIVENEPSAMADALAGSPFADRVELVPAYRSEAAPSSITAERLAAVDAAVAFAPSGVRRLAAVGRAPHVIVIGPTTARAATEWVGADRVTMAAQHDLAGVVAAAEQWWGARLQDLGSAP